jgi:hypothetical protein
VQGLNVTLASNLASVAINPSQKALIKTEGYAEAQGCTRIGLGIGATPMLVGAVAVLVALLRRERAPSSSTV